MQQLGMQGGRFEVQLQTLDAPAQHGLEEVIFLVAGHEGSTPRPVGKVASGGELSRIALAIAVTTSELGEAGTLIFDEVDSGVGGAVAETVGRLMKQLGQHRQVLAVTHLPQVAACADHHLLVSKAAAKGQVSSQVRGVVGDERVSEIARMLGGEKLSATTLAHAREMLGTPSKHLGRKAAQS
jgi:DNA repair protein RecN (Recombination protein N)